MGAVPQRRHGPASGITEEQLRDLGVLRAMGRAPGRGAHRLGGPHFRVDCTWCPAWIELRAVPGGVGAAGVCTGCGRGVRLVGGTVSPDAGGRAGVRGGAADRSHP